MSSSSWGLPAGFVFSQSSLQDYADCARRFELRYLRHCRWPAPHTRDALLWEQVTERGHALHRLLRQLHSGIDRDALERVASSDSDLLRWWNAFLSRPPAELPNGPRLAETMLQARLDRHRLEARYDLLVGEPGERWAVLDWKTNARRPDRAWLEKRFQTRVYPWILVAAGQQLNGGQPIDPAQVEMRYWFAEFPGHPERFEYGVEQYEEDGQVLGGLIAEIASRAAAAEPGHSQADGPFPRTPDQTRCRFCVYRSLCWDDVDAARGIESEDSESEASSVVDFDMEALTPIPF